MNDSSGHTAPFRRLALGIIIIIIFIEQCYFLRYGCRRSPFRRVVVLVVAVLIGASFGYCSNEQNLK